MEHSKKYLCAVNYCVAFGGRRSMYLVLPVPVTERPPTSHEVRAGVRCKTCFERRRPPKEDFRGRERFDACSGTIEEALEIPLLRNALLSGDTMSPPTVGSP